MANNYRLISDCTISYEMDKIKKVPVSEVRDNWAKVRGDLEREGGEVLLTDYGKTVLKLVRVGPGSAPAGPTKGWAQEIRELHAAALR